MFRPKSNSLYLILLLILAFSCTKENDGNDPQISFIFPAEGSFFEDNTAEVRFHVRDDLQLKSIRLAIVNEDHIPVLPPVWFYPLATDTIITHSYQWTSQFESGEYFFQVLADDGRNEKFKYLKIYISVSPNTTPDIYYISSLTGSSELWRLSSNFAEAEKIFTSNHEIIQFESGWSNGMLYVITAKPSKLMALSAEDGSLIWEKSAGMPAAEYSHFFIQNNHLLLADASGTISMLNAATGSGLLTIHHQSDTIPSRVYFDDDYIYSSYQVFPGANYLFSIYYRPTASLYKRYQMEGAVQGIFGHGARKVLLAESGHLDTILFQSWDKIDQNFEPNGVLSGHVLKRLKQDSDGNLLMVSDQGIGVINPVSISYTSIYQGSEYTDAIQHPYQGKFISSSGRLVYDGNITHQSNEMVNLLGFGVPLPNP